jgi:hypothetical protein
MERLLGEWNALLWLLKTLWHVMREDVPQIIYDWRRGRPFAKCRTCRTVWLCRDDQAYYVGECDACFSRLERIKEHGLTRGSKKPD